MNLPFLHTRAASLTVTDAHVVWASGTRLGRRLRRLVSADEPVTEGDIAAAINRLVARHPPQYVVTHLDPLHVRYALLQGPPFDEVAPFEAWLQSEARRQLPPRAPLADFVLRAQLLEQTEDHTRCLLALANRQAVEERVALLEGAGLHLVSVGSIDGAIGQALGLDVRFCESQVAVLVLREQEASLLQYQAGGLQALTALSYDARAADADSLLQDVAVCLTPMPEQILVMGTNAPYVVERARESPQLDGVVQEASFDFLQEDRAVPFPSAHLPAAALVVQHLFLAQEAFNFLEPEVEQARLQEVEKKEAVRAILALGTVVGVLLLILILVTLYLESKQAGAEAELLALADQVERIEQATQAVEHLEQDLARAERLIIERTNVAGVLEGAGRAVSEGLWLDALTVEATEANRAHLTLTGAALSKHALAVYLDSLEQAAFAHDVRLLYSETVRAEAIYKKEQVAPQALTRFEIHLAFAHTMEARE